MVNNIITRLFGPEPKKCHNPLVFRRIIIGTTVAIVNDYNTDYILVCMLNGRYE